jgi:very-short-patch-repair endonuclease
MARDVTVLSVPLPVKRGNGASHSEAGEGQSRFADRQQKCSDRAKASGAQTDAERKLWFTLRDRRLDGFKFVRQEAIGSFIVDFVCRAKKI